jgi:hypothetical protein
MCAFIARPTPQQVKGKDEREMMGVIIRERGTAANAAELPSCV